MDNLRYIFQYYLDIVKELIKTKIYSIQNKNRIKLVFNDEKMINRYQKEVDTYLKNIRFELKSLKYLINHHKEFFYFDIENTIKYLDNNRKARNKYMLDLLENLKNAVNLELPNKFYLPRNKYKSYIEDDFEDIIKIARGISKESVAYFCFKENIFKKYKHALALLEDDTVLKKTIAELNLNDFDIEIPNFTSEKDVLISIHELIYLVMYGFNNNNIKKNLQHLNIEQENIEDLALFYETLYAIRHKFQIKMPLTPNAIKLLEEYQSDNFYKQIERIKQIANISRKQI